MINKSSTLRILLIIAGVLVLGTMLAYPFGNDQAIFSIGGDMMVNHKAIEYRDFIDTKPPLIFLIYGAALWVFGHHEWSIRAFDVLFHLVTLLYFYKVLLRTLGNKTTAFTTVLLYILCVVTRGFWDTSQAETFALLPSIILYDLLDRGITSAKPWLIGIACGLLGIALVLMKFTFIGVSIGALAYLAIAHPIDTKRRINLIASTICGLLLGALIVLFFFYTTGALDNFVKTLGWLRGYAEVDPLFSMDTVREIAFKKFPAAFILFFGPTTILLAVAGIIAVGKSKDSRVQGNILHLLLQCFVGVAIIVYERKLFPYHFSRTLWCILPFVAIGLHYMWDQVLESIREWKIIPNVQRYVRLIFLGLIILVLLFFSPLSRIVTHPLKWVYAQTAHGDLESYMGTELYFYNDSHAVSDWLREKLKPADRIFLWGNTVGMYFLLEQHPLSLCISNAPFVDLWTPPQWKTSIMDSLNNVMPRFFIVEFGDQSPQIAGNNFDSWQNLQRWPEMKKYLETAYTQSIMIGHFRIFERNS